MFFKKSAASQASDLDSPTTVIGEGTFLEAARLTGQKSVRIDGSYKGLVDIDSSLVLGDTGTITGDIHAKYFLVAGEVTGKIECESQVHLASSARVFGDVHAASLVVDDGAQVSGRYIIGDMVRPAAITESLDSDESTVRYLDGNEEE